MMTVRDQIFLYCYVIYGQKEEILSALPQERMELLKKEVRKYERFPKEVRLTLVLKLLGYLVHHARNRYLEMIHPTWIAESLKNENPRVLEMILAQVSPDYKKKVLQLLPSNLALSRSDTNHQEMKDVVFHIFCRKFVSMAAPWGEPELTVSSLYLLREEDVIAVSTQIGVREIARAFCVAGKNAVRALANRFPADLQDDFQIALTAVQEESDDRHAMAAKQISKYDLASLPLEDAAFRVGIARLSSAIAISGGDVRQIAQRLPYDMGRFLLSVEEAEPTGDECKEIMDVIHKLVAKGRIDKSFVVNRFMPTADIRKKSGTLSNGAIRAAEKA